MRRETEEKKKKMEEKTEFEFCKICRINHNQGRRHKFFPRHTNCLSSLLARFQKKFSGVKSSLKNSSLSLPSEPSSSRIWCIFCDSDIDEVGSSFTSDNAITHFASEDHLKSLKHFMWKYGGGMDKVDSFRITEAELAKWDKRCEALKSEAASSSERYCEPLHGQSNDIQPNYEIMNSLDKNNIHFVESGVRKDVMPLLYDTNKNYQVYHSDISGAGKVGPFPLVGTSTTPLELQHGLYDWNSTYMSHYSQHSLLSSGTSSLGDGSFSAEHLHEEAHLLRLFLTDRCSPLHVHKNQSMETREHITEGYQKLTQISYGCLENVKGNVHSGAPPPWLDGIEANGHHGLARDPRVNNTQKNSRQASKLNPKRVGAAWAERRKLEMEMERRGEIITRDSAADWLPNFGRVWQSGTRKESMKEFKKEKLKPMAESEAEAEIQLRPYIGKRRRQDTDEVSSEGVQRSADTPKKAKNCGS